jgi:Fe-S-cluster-containing dehydrogenase component
LSKTPTPDGGNDGFALAFRLEPLRALDARGRADVRASAALRSVSVGARLFHAGEPADTLFVVLSGAVRVERARDGSAPRALAPGDVFGHEALVPFAVRRFHATAVEPSSVLELSVGVLRRALVRANGGDLLAREESRARNAEWVALLATTAFGALPPAELEALARALVELPRGRGEALDTAPAGVCWLVGGGLFELSEPGAVQGREGTLYAARGDVIGLSPHYGRGGASRAVALGNALALRIPAQALERVAARYPAALSALERVATARAGKQRRTLEAAARPATRHARDEMERLEGARSLLAIDLDRCTQCGHCAAACAASHGSARLERRGEKLVVTLRGSDATQATALLLPTACQHCREPACLEPCPTGAIRRLATGAVELDSDLCTGCGACAKACPWDAVRMAPRAEAGAPAAPDRSAEVAVKCDLCRGLDGPECVSACPTDAIFRLEPERDVVELRAAVGKNPEARRAATTRARPWRSLGALALVPPLVALDRSLPVGHGVRLAAGVAALVLVGVLCAHALVKRVARIRRRARRALGRSATASTVAPLVKFHAASGVLAASCVYLHAGLRVPGGTAGTLAVSFWAAAASGVFGALVYRLVPERWSRLERKSTLVEDEPAERERLVDRLHEALSGSSSAKKELVRHLLLPYATSVAGAFALAASGRSLAVEEHAVRVRIDRALGGHKSERLTGIDGLVRVAVEMRALRSKHLLRALLRAWLPLHLVLSVAVLLLLAFHVAARFP